MSSTFSVIWEGNGPSRGQCAPCYVMCMMRGRGMNFIYHLTDCFCRNQHRDYAWALDFPSSLWVPIQSLCHCLCLPCSGEVSFLEMARCFRVVCNYVDSMRLMRTVHQPKPWPNACAPLPEQLYIGNPSSSSGMVLKGWGGSSDSSDVASGAK